MTIDEIIRAIEQLPAAQRLRVVERVVHDLSEQTVDARDVPGVAATGAQLVEHMGFLLVAGNGVAVPLNAFDHHAIRDERIQRLATLR
jgi:hypothetical protein